MGNDKSKSKHASRTPNAPATKEPNATVASLQQMRQTMSQLQKRKDFLSKKIDKEVAEAKLKAKTNNKKGALMHLKRKKLYEKEATKLENSIFTLEQQVISIESGSTNLDVVSAMRKGATAQKAINQKLDVDQVAQMADDIQELQAEQEEVSELLSTPAVGIDDDELEKELAELGELDEEDAVATTSVEKHLELPSAPVSAPVTNLPQVPQHKPVDSQMNDDEALAALQAEMGN